MKEKQTNLEDLLEKETSLKEKEDYLEKREKLLEKWSKILERREEKLANREKQFIKAMEQLKYGSIQNKLSRLFKDESVRFSIAIISHYNELNKRSDPNDESDVCEFPPFGDA